MSISSPSGEPRDPSVVRTGAKPGAGRGPGGAGKPGAKGGRGPRKPVTPVKVAGARNWGAIALFSAVGLLTAGIIGAGVYYTSQTPEVVGVDEIQGMENYRKSRPKDVEGGRHQAGPIKYDIMPPVFGPHNGIWQNCTGDVYTEPIASEHAVHSMEHGAVWITYRPDLPKDQVDRLAGKVRGRDKMLLSPFPNLDKPIALQAWGYQLKLDSLDDQRVNEFIKTMRGTAAIENATCAEGVTTTGIVPVNLPNQG
ncbi:DUF3105 domain-containing protein [Pilimelia columellifera]|uniref:DUF3105 domain-containing protein n=1 Tax=Pilimelia columellifera subsp. columellifera TaxID=706583 RepID=A0ABP6ASF0_9ACTN